MLSKALASAPIGLIWKGPWNGSGRPSEHRVELRVMTGKLMGVRAQFPRRRPIENSNDMDFRFRYPNTLDWILQRSGKSLDAKCSPGRPDPDTLRQIARREMLTWTT